MMNIEELKVKRSILVEQMLYYESMISKYQRLMDLASSRLVQNDELLTESETDSDSHYYEREEAEDSEREEAEDSEREEAEDSEREEAEDSEREEAEEQNIRIDRNQAFIVTPINKSKSSNSNKDYNEQMERQEVGESIMWDDTPSNASKRAGGIFAFVHNDKHVEICHIQDVCSPENRLPSWTDNVGHGHRNVLILSDIKARIKWDDWIKHGGHKKVQGTTQVRSNKNRLIDYIESIIEK
jgi:hypothetical protein